MTRNGKISRLPVPIRDELNRRMENGWQGGKLLAWLNSLPEVQAVIAAEFEGKPVRKQNLSEWRKGGYAKWLQWQEALEIGRQLGSEVGELQPPGAPPLADQMAVWLSTRYLMVIRKMQEKNSDGELDFEVLRKFCHDVVALQRGGHSAARLKMEQERLEREREETEEEAVEHFKRWAGNGKVYEAICGKCQSEKELRASLREIYGRPPEPDEDAPPDGNEPKSK